MAGSQVYGKGSVYPVKGGGWMAQLEAPRGPDGKRRMVRAKRRTRREAVEALNELHRKAGRVPVGKRTVKDLVSWWLDNVKATTVQESTLNNYRTRAEVAYRFIGSTVATKLTVADVQAMVNALRDEGAKPGYVNAVRDVLSSAFRWAVGADWLERNVCDHVRGLPKQRKVDDTLSETEVDAVLATVAGDRLGAAVAVAVFVGLRQGEMLALRWTDLDLDSEAPAVRVDQSKTRAGERTVPLVGEALDALRRHRDIRRQEYEALGLGWVPSGYVFARPDGRPLSARSLREWWHRAQVSAGVEPRRWHALRHTCATMLLAHGHPLELVSKILGHATLGITSDIYARPNADRMRNALRSVADRS